MEASMAVKPMVDSLCWGAVMYCYEESLAVMPKNVQVFTEPPNSRIGHVQNNE